MILKIRNAGRVVDGLPREVVLRDERSPREVVAALASWREAVEGLQEPARVLREAEKAAQESTLQVRGERERWSAEVREKTEEERRALRAAERESTRAANALVAALKAHAREVRAIGARLALVAHAEAVDAALDVEAARGRFGRVAPRGLPALPHVDTAAVAMTRGRNLQESTLDVLDRTNVRALVEAAGEDPCGFVAVRRDRDGAEISTTPRRARSLVGGGRQGWRFVEEQEVQA